MLGSKCRHVKGQDHSLKGLLFTVPAALPASSVYPPTVNSQFILLVYQNQTSYLETGLLIWGGLNCFSSPISVLLFHVPSTDIVKLFDGSKVTEFYCLYQLGFSRGIGPSQSNSMPGTMQCLIRRAACPQPSAWHGVKGRLVWVTQLVAGTQTQD